MTIKVLKSKLHRIRVTEAYGNRFETYAIAGKRGSHVCCLNGAAAHQGSVGDRLIVMAFADMTPEEAASWQPLVKHFKG